MYVYIQVYIYTLPNLRLTNRDMGDLRSSAIASPVYVYIYEYMNTCIYIYIYI
jgi:hypothetical protein